MHTFSTRFIAKIQSSLSAFLLFLTFFALLVPTQAKAYNLLDGHAQQVNFFSFRTDLYEVTKDFTPPSGAISTINVWVSPPVDNDGNFYDDEPPQYSVDYTTVDGTAKAGIDYVAKSGTLYTTRMPDRAMTIPIQILPGVDSSEPTKSFYVRLSNPKPGFTPTTYPYIAPVIKNANPAEIRIVQRICTTPVPENMNSFSNQNAWRPMTGNSVQPKVVDGRLRLTSDNDFAKASGIAKQQDYDLYGKVLQVEFRQYGYLTCGNCGMINQDLGYAQNVGSTFVIYDPKGGTNNVPNVGSPGMGMGYTTYFGNKGYGGTRLTGGVLGVIFQVWAYDAAGTSVDTVTPLPYPMPLAFRWVGESCYSNICGGSLLARSNYLAANYLSVKGSEDGHPAENKYETHNLILAVPTPRTTAADTFDQSNLNNGAVVGPGNKFRITIDGRDFDNHIYVYVEMDKGDGYKTIIKSFDAKSYPYNEGITIPKIVRIAFTAGTSSFAYVNEIGGVDAFGNMMIGNDPGICGSSACTLTVKKTGTANGTVYANSTSDNLSWSGNTGTKSFPCGTYIAVIPKPAANKPFGGWSGEGCADTGYCYIRLGTSKTIEANFK